MRYQKQFFRGLFFIFLLICLLTGLAGIVRVPANAAPVMQGTMEVIINEVAWAGTQASSFDEWIELYNPGSSDIDLTNWRIEAADGDPSISLSGSIASNSYLLLERGSGNTVKGVGGVVYSSGLLSDTGETLYLLNETSSIVDTANADGGSWPAGNSSPTASMERYASVADSDFSWVTNDGSVLSNGLDAADNPIHGTPGADNWAFSSAPITVTTITADTPDPSSINQNVNITVTVIGAPPTPTGTVDITEGANTICTVTLVSGTGTCATQFTSNGAKLILATYNGDATHPSSSDTETHNVLPATTIEITKVTPNPSLVNQSFSVSVTVTGGNATPTGTVSVTGADTNCSFTLSSSGSGSCFARFSSVGSKTIIATYMGDAKHAGSSDKKNHEVVGNPPTATRTSTPVRTPTRTLPPPPPPPLVAINEFVPRPGHDWNNDGVVNTDDEYIEIINHGVIDVNLSGYSLDDEANIGSAPFRLPSVIIKPGQRIPFYGSQTHLLLSDGGDGVRLLKSNGQLVDAYNYFVVDRPDQSYCRLPDNGGLDDWNQNCFPTPGLPNALSGNFIDSPVENDNEPVCPIADTLPQDFALAECRPLETIFGTATIGINSAGTGKESCRI